MKDVLLFFVCVLYCLNDKIYGNPCVINEEKMNCANKQMKDCPELNSQITDLNMDYNNLEDLTSENCTKWKHLRVLSVVKNRIGKLLDFNVFTNLNNLNVSYNLLQVSEIDGNIIKLDLTHNKLHTVTVRSVGLLKSLFLGHNSLSKASINNILNSNLLLGLNNLDLSYNNLLSVPQQFSKFRTSFLRSVNLAGNKLDTVYFTYFTYKNFPSIKLDLSHNDISTVVLSEPPSIHYLDISHNKLSFFNNSTINNLLTIQNIDFSYNPFNCSCNFRPSFIISIKNKKDRFVNRPSTKCFIDRGPNLFDWKCSPASFHFPWKWVAPFFVILLAVTILVASYRLVHKNRSEYIEIGESQHSSLLSPITWLYNGRTRSTVVSADEASFSNQQIVFEESLVILCSSKSRKWVSQEITANLDISTKIIDTKVSNVPSSTYVLIVFLEEVDLKNSVLIKNVTSVFKNGDSYDKRFLFTNQLSQDVLSRNNVLSKYLSKEMIKNKSILFDPAYPLSCIDTLKVWLNISKYPYSV